MENYQMFFPCSSTGQSVYTSNSNHNAFTVGDHNSSSVFWGLTTQDFVPKLTDVKQVYPSGGFAARSENEEKLSKKKGEKVKKPRFAFQTRSHVDILDDGYRWRKYGQKAVKNNKYPRSYYRCTHQGCNVKKQIQRLTKDEGLVLTTYEGMHTHLIGKPTDNFEHILNQFQIYTPFSN